MDSTVFLFSSTTRRRVMLPDIAPTPLGQNKSRRDTSSSKSWSSTERSPSTTRRRKTNLLTLGPCNSTSNVTGHLQKESENLKPDWQQRTYSRLRRLCRHKRLLYGAINSLRAPVFKNGGGGLSCNRVIVRTCRINTVGLADTINSALGLFTEVQGVLAV